MTPLIESKLLSVIALICLIRPIPVKSHPCSETRLMRDFPSPIFEQHCKPFICKCFEANGCSNQFAGAIADGIAQMWYFNEKDFEIDCPTFAGRLDITAVNNRQYLLLKNTMPQKGNIRWLRPTRENYINTQVMNPRMLLKLNTSALFDIAFETMPWNDDEIGGTSMLYDTSISFTIFESLAHNRKRPLDHVIIGPMGGPELTQKRGCFQIEHYSNQYDTPKYNFYRIPTMGVTLENDFYIRQNEVIPRIKIIEYIYYMCLGRTFRPDGLTEWTGVGCRPVKEWADFSKQYLSTVVDGDYKITCECDFDSLGIKYPNNPIDNRTEEEIQDQNGPMITSGKDSTGSSDTPIDSGNDTNTELSSKSESKTSRKSTLAVDLTIIFASIMLVVLIVAIISGIALIVYFKTMTT